MNNNKTVNIENIEIDVNSKYRIIYTSPDTNKPAYLIINSSEYANFLLEYEKSSFSDMIQVAGVWIKKGKIEGMKMEKKNILRLNYYRNSSHWDDNPPTKEQKQALMLGVIYHHAGSLWFAMPTSMLMNVVKSVWNWQSDKTFEILKTGQDLINSGESMKSLMNKIKERENSLLTAK